MLQGYLSDIILIINNIVGLFVVIRFMNHILLKRELALKNFRAGLMVILFIAVVSNILFDNLISSIISVLLVNFSIGYLFYQGKTHVKLIAAVFIVIFSFVTELITAVSFGLLFDASIQGVRNNPMHLFLGGVVSKILLILLIELVVRYRRREASKVSLVSWLLIVSIPLMSIILAIVSVYEPVVNNQFSDMAVIACLTIIYINLIAFYLFDNIILQVDENNQMKFREEQLILQQNQYKNILSGYSQVKSIRHDMVGHMITIKGYLNKDLVSEALTYINGLHGDIDLSNKGVLSSNVAVDAIVNNRSSKAEELGIKLDHDIMIPEKMQVDDIDICIVLGNALNNAIEACQRLDRNVRKNIEVKVKYKKKSLLIEVRNPYDVNSLKVKDGKYLSVKPHRTGDTVGTGIGNIKAVAEKYQGLCEVDLQTDTFVMKIILPDIAKPVKHI